MRRSRCESGRNKINNNKKEEKEDTAVADQEEFDEIIVISSSSSRWSGHVLLLGFSLESTEEEMGDLPEKQKISTGESYEP